GQHLVQQVVGGARHEQREPAPGDLHLTCDQLQRGHRRHDTTRTPSGEGGAVSQEASFVDGPDGTRQPSGEGWFVTNLASATWVRDERAGTFCTFEADDAHFADFGINVHVVQPGQANGLYHAESVQEAFLVLHG